MLGFPPQVGYAELVARQLGHSIDKAQTRTDWSRRPLTPAQLAYAADDVHHLLPLHTDLAAALAAKGRAQWLAEDASALEDRALYQTEPADAWRRLKGLGRLKPREQAAARAIAEWRERRAIESDKPRGWILADEVIYALATAGATHCRRPRGGPVTAARGGPQARRGTAGVDAGAVESPDMANVQSATQRATPEENALVTQAAADCPRRSGRTGDQPGSDRDAP